MTYSCWVPRQEVRGRTVCQIGELTAHGEGSDQPGKLVCGHTAVGEDKETAAIKYCTRQLPIALTWQGAGTRMVPGQL